MKPEQLEQAMPDASREAARKQIAWERAQELISENHSWLGKMADFFDLIAPTIGTDVDRANVDIILKTGQDPNRIDGLQLARISAVDYRTTLELNGGRKMFSRSPRERDVLAGYKITYDFIPNDPRILSYRLAEEVYAIGNIANDRIIPWHFGDYQTAEQLEKLVKSMDESNEMALLRNETDFTIEMLMAAASRVDLNPYIAMRIIEHQNRPVAEDRKVKLR